MFAGKEEEARSDVKEGTTPQILVSMDILELGRYSTRARSHTTEREGKARFVQPFVHTHRQILRSWSINHTTTTRPTQYGSNRSHWDVQLIHRYLWHASSGLQIYYYHLTMDPRSLGKYAWHSHQWSLHVGSFRRDDSRNHCKRLRHPAGSSRWESLGNSATIAEDIWVPDVQPTTTSYPLRYPSSQPKARNLEDTVGVSLGFHRPNPHQAGAPTVLFPPDLSRPLRS